MSVSSGFATLFRQHTVPCASCTAHATVEVNVETAPSVVVVLVAQHRQPVIDRMLVLSDGIFRAPARSAATQSEDVYSVRAVCAEVPLPAADVAATDSSATTGSSAVAATATLLYPEAADDPILVVNGIDDTGNSRVAVIVPAGAAAMFPRAIFYVNQAAHKQTRLRTQLIPETYRQAPADPVTVAASIAGGGAASAMLTAAAGGRAAASAMPTVAPASAVYAHADSASRHALYDGPAMSASSIFDVAATSLSTRAGEPPPAAFTAATVADGKYVNSASRSTYGAAAAAVDFEDDDEERYASHHLGEDSDEEHDDVGYDLAVSTGGCGVSASASASASQNVPTAGGVCFPSVPASTQAGAVGRASIGDRSAPAAHLTTSSAPTVITRTASASYAAARDASVHLAPRASLASHGGGGLHASAHARAGPSPFSYEGGVPPPFSYEGGVPPSGDCPMRTHGAGYGGGAHPSVAPHPSAMVAGCVPVAINRLPQPLATVAAGAQAAYRRWHTVTSKCSSRHRSGQCHMLLVTAAWQAWAAANHSAAETLIRRIGSQAQAQMLRCMAQAVGLVRWTVRGPSARAQRPVMLVRLANGRIFIGPLYLVDSDFYVKDVRESTTLPLSAKHVPRGRHGL